MFGLQPLAGRLWAVGDRARRDPGRLPAALHGGGPPLRHRPVGAGRDRLGRDPARPLARARRALGRERVRLLRRADAVLRRRVGEHVGAVTASTATATGAGHRTTRRTRSPPPRATCALRAHRRTTGAALFAYNHADWYVAQVLAKAGEYRGAPRPGAGLVLDPGTVRELLANLRIVLTPVQRADLLAGAHRPAAGDDARGDRPPPLGRDHGAARPTTTRAPTTRPAARWTSARSTARSAAAAAAARARSSCASSPRSKVQLRSTELIYCWDPDGPA